MVDVTKLAVPGTEEERLLGAVDLDRLPRHVAIIMDGNGRWARRRHLPRVAGHRAGVESVRNVVEAGARLGLEVLTLYAFSQENWKRPRTEVEFLMELLREFARKELATLRDNDIRFRTIGRVDDLPRAVRSEIEHAVEETRDCRGLTFVIALSYGGRSEIVDAVRAVVRDGLSPDEVDEATLESRLYTAGLPDPDLLIRTSGEMRVSNFLLWQIAYAELWVTPVLWPDFRRKELYEAIGAFQRRERRYGGLLSEDGEGNPSTVLVRR